MDPVTVVSVYRKRIGGGFRPARFGTEAGEAAVRTARPRREFQKILADYVCDCTTVTSPWPLFPL